MLDMLDYIRQGSEARLKISVEDIEFVASALRDSILKGGKLVVFGNGGSAADAQHFAAELTGRFMKERKSLPAIALSTNTSALTAIGNDYSFEDVFSRQVSGLVTSSDTVVGISTSGNSSNVVYGLEVASRIGAFTVAMTGSSGGKISGIAKKTLRAESSVTPIIQEIHICMIHMICMRLDELLG